MTRVKPLVLSERLAEVKGSTAEFTDVRSLACVNTFVSLDIGRVEKLFPAEPTDFFTGLLLRFGPVWLRSTELILGTAANIS